VCWRGDWPLAKAGVSIFRISTYDTDFVMVKEKSLNKALKVLCAAGHRLTHAEQLIEASTVMFTIEQIDEVHGPTRYGPGVPGQ